MNTTSSQWMGAAGALLLGQALMAVAANAADAPVTGLQEIIVTAEKRDESAQRVPLAVTSISAADLAAAHINGADELQRVVPNVRVDVGGTTGDPGGANALFSIRGLGASATGPQGSPGVAVHFDGVYRQNGLSNGEFFDLQRIEVDPGPQGTLYGRSAAAGAVNVIPNQPSQKWAASATLEGGNYGAIRTEGMLNAPINDTLAIRAAFQTIRHDGYYANGYDDQRQQAGRLQALLTPTSNFSLRLYADYVHIGGRGASDIFVGGPGIAQLVGLLPQVGSSDERDRSIAQYCASNGQIVDTCRQQIDVTKWSTHVDARYEFGWGVLTVLPAFNAQTADNRFANAPLPLSNYNQDPYNQDQANLEIRLNDAGASALKWVAGLNYFHNHSRVVIDQNVNILAPLPTPGGPIPGLVAIEALDAFSASQESYAAFGQITFPVRDWLRVTAGARYNNDKATYDGELATNSQNIYVLNGPLVATPVPTPINTGPLNSSASFNDVTYRFSVDADVGPHSMVYASIGTGYKPGGLNDGGPASANTPQQLAILSAQTGVSPDQLAALAPPQSFGPEKVTHYELGSKNRFLDNRLEINDALYFDNYTNYQNGNTQVVNPLLFRTQGFVVTNAGRSRVYGNELTLKFQASDRDLISASMNYLHAYFTRYDAAAYLTPNGPIPAQDFGGKVLPNAPKLSGNLSYAHRFSLPNGADLTGSVFTHLTDGYWVYFAQAPGTYQPGYSNTTVDLTWSSPEARWSVTAFVKNVEDKTIRSFGILSTQYTSVHLAAPRTYGLSVTLKAM